MAEQVAKGITISFRGDTADFDKSVSMINKELKGLNTTLKDVNQELKLQPANLDLINKKQATLNDLIAKAKEKENAYKLGIEATKQKIKELQKQQDALTESAGGYENLNEKQLETFKNLELEISQLNNALKSEQKEYDKARKAVENYSKQVDGLIQKEVSKYFKNQADKFGAVGDAFVLAGKKMQIASATATAGLVAMTKSAGDFEQQWLAVEKVLKPVGSDSLTGTNLKSWEDIQQEIKDMAITLPVSMEKITQAFANSAQLGVANDNLKEFVETMMRLDSATNITADEGAIQIAQLYNIMGADINNVDNFANALVRLGNTSATTERSILEMASTLAGSSRNVGFTEYQVLALADALASAGLNSASAGSSISTILTNIDKSVAKVKKDVMDSSIPIEKIENEWASLLNINPVDFANAWDKNASSVFVSIIGALRNVKDISEETKNKYKDLFDAIEDGADIEKNLNTAMSQLGITTIRQDRSIKALVNSYELLERQMVESEDAFFKGNDAVDESDRAWSSFNSSVQLLKNNIGALAREFGEQLLPVVEPIVKKVSEIVNSIANLDAGVKKVILRVMAIVALIAPTLLAIGGLLLSLKGISLLIAKLATLFPNIALFLASLKTAPLATLLSALTSPLGIIIALVTALVAGFAYCWKNIDGFKESMLDLWQAIKDAFSPIIQLLIDLLGNMWSLLKMALIPAFQNIMSLMGNAIQLVARLIESILLLAGWLWDKIEPIIRIIATIISTLLVGAIDVVINQISAIIQGVSSVIDWTSKAINKILELIGLKKKADAPISSDWDGSKTAKATGLRSVLDNIQSGGLGINTNGLNFASAGVGNTISLQTSINVNNNGVPIDASVVRGWADTITDIVSNNIGRRL